MPTQRILVVVLLVVMLLLLINSFRQIITDPIERDRLNPEQRPRVQDQNFDYV